MFYTYRQNNSGGSFYGAQYVIVEADSASEADDIALAKTPVYFDGCSTGQDCSCCGDRWDTQSTYYWQNEGYEFPSTYGEWPLPTNQSEVDQWVEENYDKLEDAWSGMDVDIYFRDGRVEEIRFDKKHYEKADKKKKAVTPSVYGFRYYSNWDEPSKVVKAWRSDYDANKYWDKTGNEEVVVNPKTKKLGWYRPTDSLGSDFIHFSAETKGEAEQARKAFTVVLEAAREAANKAALEELKSVDLPNVPKNFLKKVYS